MKKYLVKYVHKISSSSQDVGMDIYLGEKHLQDRKVLGAVLRERRCLETGRSIQDFRVEKDGKVVVFPLGGIWHSIILTPV